MNEDEYLIDLTGYTHQEDFRDDKTKKVNKVYIIKDKDGNSYVAKTIQNQTDQLQRKYFSREIRILLKVQHQTIVSMKGFSYSDIKSQNNITFVMRYMQKGNLGEKFVDDVLQLDFQQRQIILIGISFGMMLLHKHHIIHRDLKPENILLYDDEKPCLTDFNVSKNFNPQNAIDQSMTCCGSSRYISPELYANYCYDVSTDVYSFGIIMCEFLTGKRAYKDQTNPFELLEKVKKGERPFISVDIKNNYPGFISVIDRCISEDTSKRPTFRYLFKKLSLMSSDFFRQYEDKLPFLKDENDFDGINCCFENVTPDMVKPYVEQLLNETEPEKLIDETKFSQTKEICNLIFDLDPMIKIDNNEPFNIMNGIPKDGFKDIAQPDFLNNLLIFFPNSSEFNSIKNYLSNLSLNEFNDFFLFPIIYKNLKEIEDNINNIKQELYFKIYSFYAFFTWISFSFRILIDQKKKDILPLLKILNHIKKESIKYITNSNSQYPKPNYHNIASFCFVDLIKLAVENEIIDDYAEIIQEMKEFYDDALLPDKSDEIIQTLVVKLVNQREELNKPSSDLIDMISYIYDNFPDHFSVNTIQTIIEQIMWPINNFDKRCLVFFEHSSNKIDIDLSFKILKNLIEHVLLELEKDEIDLSENSDKPLSIENVSDYFHTPDDLYQLNKIDSPNVIDFFEPLESFQNNELKEQILLISRAITSSKELAQKILDYLTDKLKQIKTKKYFYQKTPFVLFLMQSIIQKYTAIILSSSLFNNELIFDTNNTYFTQKNNYKILVSIRHFVINFLINYDISVLKKILEIYSLFPHLFLECLYHIKWITEKNENSGLNLCSIADTLTRSLVNYRITSDTKDNDELFLKIRKAIFSLFKYYQQETSFFTSPNFLAYYFILLTEPPIRDDIINYLSMFLKSVNKENLDDKIAEALAFWFRKIFVVCYTSKEMKGKEGIDLIHIILELLNDVTDENEILLDVISPIILNFVNSLLKNKVELNEIDNLDCLVIPLIDFLFKTYQNKEIDETDSSLLESLINRFFPKLKQVQIINKLVMIIANKKMSIISPTFEIKQPKLLCSLFSIFIKTSQIYNIVDFFNKLCSFSTENCIKCHEGQLDLFIIDHINEWRIKINSIIPSNEARPKSISNYFEEIDEFVFEDKEDGHLLMNEKLIDVFLNLFSTIASTISSVPVVYRYFSLLSPNDQGHYSLIHTKIINSMNTIMKNLMKTPFVPFPMQQKHFKVFNIDGSYFENGFSFVFWISLSSLKDENQQTVFKLFDGSSHEFCVDIKGDSLRANVVLDKCRQEYLFQMKIGAKTWFMITITSFIDKERNINNVILYINDKKNDHKNFGLTFRPENQVKCIISDNTNKESYDPNLLGLFMLTKSLSDDDVVKLYKKGQRSPFLISNSIIFAYKPQYENNSIAIKPIYEAQNISHKDIDRFIPNNYVYSFFDLLLNHFDFNIITPIFGQLNKTLIDGTKCDSITTLSVEILSNLFSLGEEFQLSFYSSNCFYIISRFLEGFDESILTFNLYGFYSDLLQIISNVNLQKQLIDAILMNYNLWSKSDSINKKNIFKNWSTNLYQEDTFKPIIDSIKSPEWFLFKVHKCFDPKNLEDTNYLNCRKALKSITKKSFESKITINHLLLIIFLISESTTLIEKKDMADFLIEILNDENFIKNLDLSQIIRQLLTIFDTQPIDGDIIYQIISLINTIYSKEKYEIKDTLDSIIQSIFIKLNNNNNDNNNNDNNNNDNNNNDNNNNDNNNNDNNNNDNNNNDNNNNDNNNNDNNNNDNNNNDNNNNDNNNNDNNNNDNNNNDNNNDDNNNDDNNNNDNNNNDSNNSSFPRFKFLIEKLKFSQKNILPLLCISIDKRSKEWSNYFIKQIGVNPDYYVDKTSPFFVAFLLFKLYGIEDYQRVIDKSVTLFKSHIIELIYAINTIGYYCYSQQKFDQIQHDVLLSILRKKQYLPENTKALFYLIRNFLFFRSAKKQTSLEQLHSTSCFNENKNNNNTNNDDDKSIIDIISNITSFDNDIEYKFGLRLVPKWLDLDLAKQTIELFKEIDIPKNRIDNSKLTQTMNILFYFIGKFEHDLSFIANEKVKISSTKHIKLKIISQKEYCTQIESEKKNYYGINSEINNFAQDIHKLFITNYLENVSINVHDLMSKYQEFFDNVLFIDKELSHTIENEYLNLINSLSTKSSWTEFNCVGNERLKRDETFCIDYCPFKVVKNSSHSIDESKIENLGNIKCTIITIEGEEEAYLIINQRFVFLKKVKSNDTTIIESTDIDYVLFTCKNQEKSVFQILTKSGKNFYLYFKNKSIDALNDLFDSFQFMNSIDKTKLLKIDDIQMKMQELTDLWVNNKISNFDYLMKLNILSGRSFNDIDQYPVFPWILTNYESDKLDLNEESSYRDLSKPVGAFEETRLRSIQSGLNKYLYKSGYSNRFSVMNWLYRLEPFFTKSQNEFDDSYTKFKSILEAFKDVNNNDNDHRELIPEFFFLPEFLTSNDGDNVELPRWSNNSPIEFIYQHRKALESDFVSSHLNDWIDLIWGYKQDGSEAARANNTFSPDVVIPFKLFNTKHPARNKFDMPKSSIDSTTIPNIQPETNLAFQNQTLNRQQSATIKFLNVSSPVTVYVTSEKSVLTFKIIDSKGNFFNHSIEISELKSKEIKVEEKIIKNIKNDGNRPVFISANMICFVDKNLKQVNVYNCENWTLEQITFQNFEIESIESDEKGYLAVCSNDSSVTLFNLTSKIKPPSVMMKIASASSLLSSQKLLPSSSSNTLFSSNRSLVSRSSSNDRIPINSIDSGLSDYSVSFYSYIDTIHSVGISQEFKTIVCGTSDNRLLFCQFDLDQITLSRVVKVDGRPKKIIVTDNFGFVVVLLTQRVECFVHQKLVLFNINGNEIRTLDGDDIVQMTCASSTPGCFDYLIIADKSNRIFVLEAYSLSLKNPIFTCKSKITQLKYLRDEMLILAVCEDGTVNVIFHPIIG